MKNLLIILLVICFAGCRTVKESTNTSSNTDTLIIRHDSLMFIPADSAFIKAYFKCDSLNNVVMTELSIEKGRKITPVVQFKDRLFSVNIPVDSEKVSIKWNEIHTKSNIAQTIHTVEQVKVYPKFMIILAAIGALSILFLIVKLISIFKPKITV